MAARAARPRWRRLPVERNEEYAIVFGPAEKFRRTMEDVPVKTDCRFRAFEHVRLKREFDRVFQEGRAFELREISVRALPNGLGHARLGLCVGKRHGNAVRRNRIKRLRVNKAISQQAERIYRESRYSRESLKYTYQEAMENHPTILKREGAGGRFERWPDNERFPEDRFNPDRIPAPIISRRRAA